ncbi:Putative flocculin [Komagataella phaffii]|nr:GQ67_04310T0 [Komagataella phaffii]AOA69598.1 GQ68_04282T0 [Komagataella phaffii GS115]CAH2451432.1 Putative flocculin [Komagataella phaffii CBS 7435]
MSKTKNGGSEFVHIAYVFHIEASTPSDYINMIQIVLFPHQAQITKRMNLVTLLVCNLLCVSLTLGQGVYRLKFPALVVTGRESVGTTVVNYDFLVGNTGQYGDLGEFFYDGEPYYCWNSTDSQPLSCSSSSSLLISTQNVTISHPDEDGTVYAYAERDGGLLGRFTVGSVSADWPQWAVIVYSTSSSAHPSSWYVDDNKLKLTSGLGPNNSTTLQACYFTQSSGRDRYAISLEGSPAYTGQVSCQATEFDLEFIPPSADTTSIWDGSYTTWTTDSNGIVVEQIPTPSADTTSIWTGSETSWTTDSDGTVIELVPTPSADATSIWTGDHTTWTTDSEGNVIEQIPTPSADTTSIWTGSETSWTTDSDGTVIELVPTPSADATSIWTGDHTTWTTDSEGNVIEQIPTPSADATSIWTGDHTTWTTDREGNVIEQIPTPSADTTSIWTGSETSWTTDSDGTVIELVPTPSADATSIWTGDHTTWTTDSEGNVIEQIPTPSADATSIWTGSETSWTTDSDGTVIELVPTPSADATSIWTGDHTTWTTDSEGNVIEQIPTPSADATSIWTGDHTTWTTDSEGNVIEQIPTPSADTTSIWTGSETSWTTDSDGTVIELVPTPSADATSIWTGDHTTWTTDSEGNVIEQIPTPSADATSIWTGDHTTWTTDSEGNVIEQIPTPSADTTSIWTGSETSWTTDSDGTVIELVPTPSADATSIWTGDHTTWTTDSEGNVIEQIPTPSADATSIWTGDHTTWTTDSEGNVIEQIPTPSADTTSIWTGSETSWTTDSDGTVIELVPTPSADATSIWTGDHTTWTTDSEGNVIEQIPTPSADATSIWTGSETSWTTDSDGTVIELVPTPSADATSIWTGDHTTWTTDSEGNVIEQIPTPSADATSIWTGDHTTWTTDSEGNVIEQIPTPSADTTSIWTGDHTTWTTEVGGDGSSIVVELVPSETGTATNVVQTPVPSSGISDGVSALDGFNVEVFHYPADNYELANEISFLSYGYENLGLVTTATGVSDINFDTDSNWPSYIDRNALGNTGSYVNATIKYEGFFRAPVDGDYEFSFSNIDYNSILFVGSAAADQALRKREAQFLKPETSPNHILFFNNSRDVGQTISTTQYLSADSYYPLRVVIAAVSQHALLDFQIKLPNGVSLTQFQGYVYNFALEGAESTTVIGDKTSTWTGTYTTWTTDSEGSTIVLCPSIISDHNGKPADTTLTDGSISTTVVTVTSCDIKKCTKTTALTGVTQKTLTVKGTTTVVTAYCPLPTDVATVKTISVGGSEVLQTVYTAKPSHIVPDVQTLTVTITREVCDALTCIPATIVTGEILKTTTLADTHSTTVIPVYVPLETHQPALDLITLETVLKSSDFANGPAITSVSVESLSHQSGVVVSEFDSDSTSGAVSQPSSAVSLQTGKASALKWSPFLGAAVISLFNVFFV